MPESVKGASDSRRGSLWTFFALVFAFSIPFWIIGAATGLEVVPGLPVAALMAMCPAIAALIVTAREGSLGDVRDLLGKIFDYRKLRAPWLLLIVLFKPAVMVLSFTIMRAFGVPVPTPHFSVATIALLFAAFFVFAIGEELGWSGYATDRLQAHRSALQSALIVGVIWAAWHLVPLVQAHRAPAWIAWWCVGTVATRVIIVWIYNKTNRSVFGAILYHDIDNVAWLTFPVIGSYFDPRVTGLLLLGCAVIVATVRRRDAKR